MKKIFALAFILMLFAQASLAQTTHTEKRELTGFNEVSFAVSGEVFISLGKTFSVELEGDRDYLREIITEVVG